MPKRTVLLALLVAAMLGLAIGLFIYASSPEARGAEPPPAKCTDRTSSAECLLRKYWPGDDDKAVRVAGCESTGDRSGPTYDLDPGATGSAGERGTLQLHPVHRERVASLGYSWDDMYDAGKNTIVAWDLFTESGWEPWTCGGA
jgi:hypothetical protein